VQDHCSYDYAIVRVVPRVEREEFVNVGVIVSCPAQDFLEARIELDPQRLLALDPSIDLDAVRAHAESIPLICKGDPAAGPIGKLSPRERFHWLVAPRSTIIRNLRTHSNICSQRWFDHHQSRGALIKRVPCPVEKRDPSQGGIDEY
jgi:Protein of unknown function (DUF3037)